METETDIARTRLNEGMQQRRYEWIRRASVQRQQFRLPGSRVDGSTMDGETESRSAGQEKEAIEADAESART